MRYNLSILSVGIMDVVGIENLEWVRKLFCKPFEYFPLTPKC